MQIFIIETEPGQISILTEKQYNKLYDEMCDFGGIRWDLILYVDEVDEIKIFDSTFKIQESG